MLEFFFVLSCGKAPAGMHSDQKQVLILRSAVPRILLGEVP